MRRGPERKICFVLECKNSDKTTPHKQFFRIPMNDPNRRIAWFSCCHKEAAYFSKTFAPFICEDHFDLREDLENYLAYSMMGQRPRFKPDVVPHKFEGCRGEKTSSRGTSSGASEGSSSGVAQGMDGESSYQICDMSQTLGIVSCDAASLCSAEIKEEVLEIDEDQDANKGVTTDEDEASSSQNQVWLTSVKIEHDEETEETFEPLDSECSSSNIDTEFVKMEPEGSGDDNFISNEEEMTDDYDLIDYTHPNYMEGSTVNANNESTNTVKKLRRTAVKKLHECYICQKFCTDINRHLLIHSGERQHVCQICKKPFKRLDYLRNHLINVHRIIWVGKTKQMMSIGLIAHVAQSESEKPAIIPMQSIVPESSPSLPQLEQTTISNSESCSNTESQDTNVKKQTFKCPQCPKQYKFLVHLNKHLILHSNKKKLYKCDICKKVFVYREYLIQHIEKHMELQTSPSVKDSEQSTEVQQNPSECSSQQSTGQVNGKNVSVILTSQKAELPTSSTGVATRAANVGRGQFVIADSSQLDQRAQRFPKMDSSFTKDQPGFTTCDQEVVQDECSSDDDGSEDINECTKFYSETLMNRAILYKCKLCFQKSKSQESMKKHIEMIHAENYKTGLLCHHCNLCFDTRISLLNHISILHPDNPCVHTQYYYRCKLCLCCFVNKVLFEVHFDNLHLEHVNELEDFTDDKLRYSCVKIASQFHATGGSMMTIKVGKSISEFEAASSGNSIGNKKPSQEISKVITTFRDINAEPIVKTYICNICNVKLGSNKLLDDHTKLHTNKKSASSISIKSLSSIEKTSFYCKICDQYYACKDELKIHLMDHKRRYVCKMCGVEYKSQITLTRHLKEIHRKVCTRLDKPSPLRCKVCFKKCASMASLKDHENVHTGAQPHQCPVCNISFSLVETLKSHLQLVHMV